MQIFTESWNWVEVTVDQAVYLTDGLPGFRGRRMFFLLNRPEDAPIQWLQSADDPSLSLPVLDPELVMPGYSCAVLDPASPDEQCAEGEAMELRVILVIPSDARHVTVNLRAPLLIDRTTRVGNQVLLANEEYHTRHRLFDPQSDGGLTCADSQSFAQ